MCFDRNDLSHNHLTSRPSAQGSEHDYFDIFPGGTKIPAAVLMTGCVANGGCLGPVSAEQSVAGLRQLYRVAGRVHAERLRRANLRRSAWGLRTAPGHCPPGRLSSATPARPIRCSATSTGLRRPFPISQSPRQVRSGSRSRPAPRRCIASRPAPRPRPTGAASGLPTGSGGGGGGRWSYQPSLAEPSRIMAPYARVSFHAAAHPTRF
jgi:hypothetical protein